MKERELKEDNLVEETDSFWMEDVEVKVVYNESGPDAEECIRAIMEDYVTIEAG